MVKSILLSTRIEIPQKSRIGTYFTREIKPHLRFFRRNYSFWDFFKIRIMSTVATYRCFIQTTEIVLATLFFQRCRHSFFSMVTVFQKVAVKLEVEMAPTAVEKKPAAAGDDKKKKFGKPRNYDLGNGVYRFSRTRMYHKKALYKFVNKKVPPTKKPVKPTTIVKPIGGEKNGGTRTVLVRKRRSYYPTQDKIKKRPAKKLFKQHVRRIRPNLVPGTVLILLAGAHKGKRVILLKRLHSGLLVVTGPFEINGCPMRRISQRYVIGTQTRIDVSDVKLPDNINDDYFRRERKKRAKKEEGDIFQAKKEGYKVSEQRKADQKVVDKQVIAAIKKSPDRKLLLGYLASMFGLKSSQYPHRMQF